MGATQKGLIIARHLWMKGFLLLVAAILLHVPVVLSSEQLPVYSFPLEIQPSGAYAFRLEVGTPPQELVMLLDINTANTVIPVNPWCEDSEFCFATNGYYPTNSTSVQVVQCDSQLCNQCGKVVINSPVNSTDVCFMSTIYNKRSIHGSTYVDSVIINDVAKWNDLGVNLNFGGICKESLSFEDVHVDGIFGLGVSHLASGMMQSWFSALVQDKSIQNVYSLCLSNQGGMVTLGGSDSQLYSGFMVYTPFVISELVLFTLESFEVNGQFISAPDTYLNPGILDITVSSIILGDVMVDEMLLYIESTYCEQYNPPTGMCGQKTLWNGYCFMLTDSLSKYPSLSFQFAGSSNLTLEPRDYLVNKQGYYCNSIIRSTTTQSGAVFGANFLRKYYVEFNFASNQAGFAKSVGCEGMEYAVIYSSGDGQSGPIRTDVKQPFVIQVTRYNDSVPVAGVRVQWSISFGDGILLSYDNETDVDGYARAYLQYGPVIGTNAVTVTVDKAIGSPVVFDVTGTQGFWFYSTNIAAVIGLLLVFGVFGRHQWLYQKAKEEEEARANQPRPGSRRNYDNVNLGNKDEGETMNLLDWAVRHDNPVRNAK